MNPQLELFVLPWGVYPRRILLYLALKGLDSSEALKITPVTVVNTGMHAPGKPAGTVPILKLPDGTFIKQSVAILDYLEDVCDRPDETKDWQVKLSKAAAGNSSMRGSTPEERARIREMLGLADEATSHFGFACHKGTALFVPLEPTHAFTAKLVLDNCRKTLKLLEGYYDEESSRKGDGSFSIADCVLFSLLQFAKELYGKDLTIEPELQAIRRFYTSFEARLDNNTKVPFYPEQIKALAQQWLPVE